MTSFTRSTAPGRTAYSCIGAAAASAWILSGDALPYAYIQAGLDLVSLPSGADHGDANIVAFFAGGRDLIAAAGLDLLERVKANADALHGIDTQAMGAMCEMSNHLVSRCSEAGPWVAKAPEIADELVQQAEAARASRETSDGLSDAPVVDPRSGLVDALYNTVKAWTAFSLARRAFLWACDRIRKDRSAVPDAATAPDRDTGIPDMQPRSQAPVRAPVRDRGQGAAPPIPEPAGQASVKVDGPETPEAPQVIDPDSSAEGRQERKTESSMQP